MILVVAIAVAAVFYDHLEISMGRKIRGFRSVLAWVQLAGMNVGRAATTITMIFAGLAGSGVLGLILCGSDSLLPNTAIMDQFIAPTATYSGVLSIGMISGGLAYVMTYLRNLP
jgi:hypothetical protein